MKRFISPNLSYAQAESSIGYPTERWSTELNSTILHIFRGSSANKLCDGIYDRDLDVENGRCITCEQLRELGPRELMVRLGKITSWVLASAICGNDKACRRRFAARLKRMGARYDNGGGWLYPSWNWGIPDLHWHPDDAKWPNGRTKRDLYVEELGVAPLELLNQSLGHELVRQALGKANWVAEVRAEIARRSICV